MKNAVWRVVRKKNPPYRVFRYLYGKRDRNFKSLYRPPPDTEFIPVTFHFFLNGGFPALPDAFGFPGRSSVNHV